MKNPQNRGPWPRLNPGSLAAASLEDEYVGGAFEEFARVFDKWAYKMRDELSDEEYADVVKYVALRVLDLPRAGGVPLSPAGDAWANSRLMSQFDAAREELDPAAFAALGEYFTFRFSETSDE